MAKAILNADPLVVTVTQGNFVDVTVTALQRRVTIRTQDAHGEEISINVVFRPLGLIQTWAADIDAPFTATLLSSTSSQSVWRVTWPS